MTITGDSLGDKVIFIAGSWNEWGEWTKLTENDGVWTATLKLDAGDYEFKFILANEDKSAPQWTLFNNENREIKAGATVEAEHEYETPAEVTEVTYKFTCTQDWAFKTTPLFVHYWGGADGAAWKQIEYNTEGVSEVTVKVPSDATGCLLVRCAAGTTTPSWSATGDDAGRIYNKTGDVNFVKGTTEYAVTFQ